MLIKESSCECLLLGLLGLNLLSLHRLGPIFLQGLLAGLHLVEVQQRMTA